MTAEQSETPKRAIADPAEDNDTVAMFHRIDAKINALREQRQNDPDSLGDKIIKFALPSLAGLLVGKLFESVWNKGMSRRNLRRGLAPDAPQGLALSIAFAALSAAIGAVASSLSDRGSQALIDRRHHTSSR